jgi:predicted methyltransferase
LDDQAAGVLSRVAAAVGLREGPAGVEDLLRQIHLLGPTATRELSRRTGLPVPLVTATANELREAGLLARTRPAELSDSGRRLVALLGAPAVTLQATCPQCGGAGVVVPQALDQLRERLASIVAGAPPADTTIDQSHCTPESKLRRVTYLLEAGALAGRSVLLLGDDDCIATCIGLVCRTVDVGLPRRLTVVDVDSNVIEFNRSQLDGLETRVELLVHDLRRPLPDELIGGFDAVLTDPPYTLAGAELFLSRAASSLRPGPGGQVFLCFGPKSAGETAALQHSLTGMGFSIHGLVRNFNEYLGASVLAGTSHLYHLVTGAGVTAAVSGDFDGPLYTGDHRPPLRAYRCRGCHSIVPVGPSERWATIRDLQRAGCPNCGGSTFRPERGPGHHRNRAAASP